VAAKKHLALISLRALAKGSFSGLSEHVTTGTVTIERSDEGYSLILHENFSLDGAPDPTVAFGNGKYVAETTLGKLQNLAGKQTYIIPATIDPRIYSQVYIWCEQFSVPLGVAALDPTETDEALDDTYGS